MATPVQDVTIRDRQTDEPDHFQMNVAADFPGKKVIGVRKQGRIRGNPVADGWAGAVMQKTLGIQKCDGQTNRRMDGPTDQHGKV